MEISMYGRTELRRTNTNKQTNTKNLQGVIHLKGEISIRFVEKEQKKNVTQNKHRQTHRKPWGIF
jgi:hypothetical protein